MHSVSILGCGWLGKPLGVALLRSGYTVLGSVTQQEKLAAIAETGIEPCLLKFDPQPAGDYSRFFQSEILIISIPPRRKTGLTTVYLEQLQNVVQEAQRGTISHIVFISSTAVYPDLNRIVYEDDAAVDSYLTEAEKIVITSGIQTTVIRFGGLIGAGRHPGRFLAGKQEVPGRTSPVNMIHQEDCIKIIQAVVERDAWGEIFNACADEHPARGKFYFLASKQLGLEPPHFIEEDNSAYKIVCSEKLKKRLKYTFIYPDPLTMF
ncbi:SDR family oxidoreductase [Ohtaekwangia sp.]|uniref:SDR family oxidoreductase n=1 Tax=Ohtaekwangia sp. TaxID=2066019 RepID=UPI002FDE7E24